MVVDQRVILEDSDALIDSNSTMELSSSDFDYSVLASSEISSLSDSQERVIAVLTIISGSLSILGSSIIVYLILKNPRKTPYKRLMLGLSISDIVASTTWILSPFLVPMDTSQRIWARGTDSSCSILGFLTQISFAAIWYNGMLSFYYLFTVRLRVKTATIATYYEPVFHALSIGYNVIAGIIGYSKEFYSETELGMVCFIAEYPRGCEYSSSECVGSLIGWISAGVPTVVMFVSVLINNLVIGLYLRRTVQPTTNKSMRGRALQRKRIKAVASQGLLYVGTFVLAYSWAFILRVLESTGTQASDEARLFPLLVLSAFFLPMQGVFNLFVYSRPNYLRLRKEFPTKSKYFALKRAWFGASGGNLTVSADNTIMLDQKGSLFSPTNAIPNVDQVRLRVSQQFSATYSGKDPLRRDIRMRSKLNGYGNDEVGDPLGIDFSTRTTPTRQLPPPNANWTKENHPMRQHHHQPPTGVLGLVDANNYTPTSLVMGDESTKDPRSIGDDFDDEKDGVQAFSSSTAVDVGVVFPEPVLASSTEILEAPHPPLFNESNEREREQEDIDDFDPDDLSTYEFLNDLEEYIESSTESHHE